MIKTRLPVKIKNLAISGILCLFFLLASCNLLLLNISFKQGSRHALASSQVTISNSNFDDGMSTGSAFPASPNNWTKISGYSEAAVKTGVISAEKSSFENNASTKYGLDATRDYPGIHNTALDNSVLMISAPDKQANFGYESSSFNLPMRSYFQISVWAKTSSYAGGYFSLYLVDEATKEEQLLGEVSFEEISSSVWKKHTFFIGTSVAVDSNVHLELFLGSRTNKASGVVFFDDISCTQMDETAYNIQLNYCVQHKNSFPAVERNLRQGIRTDLIKNGRFTEGRETPKYWERESVKPSSDTGIYDVEKKAKFLNFEDIPAPGGTPNSESERYLFVYNTGENKIEFKSNEFIVSKNMIYRISVWATSGLTSAAKISLKTLEYQKNGIEITGFESLPESVHDVANSGWTEYSFYIMGHNIYDAKMQLSLWQETTGEETRAYAFYADCFAETITALEYENGKNGSNSKEIQLGASSNASSVTNGYFNTATHIEWQQNKSGSLTAQYPLTASSWAQESGHSNFNAKVDSKSGIIDVNQAHFEEQESLDNYKGMGNPGLLPWQLNRDPDTASNNVLAIGNTRDTSQAFISSPLTLEIDSLYKISFDVKTQIADGSASVLIMAGEVVISGKHDITNESTNGEWKHYDIYVKTGLIAHEITIELWFGSATETAYGYVFFDNVEYESITDETNIPDNAALENLSVENFAESKLLKNHLATYESTRWSGSRLESGDNNTSGSIINVSNNDKLVYDYAYFANQALRPGAPEGNTSSNILMLRSLTATEYVYTSNLDYSITADEYYKFSFWVKTSSYGFRTDPDTNRIRSDINQDDVDEDGEEFVNERIGARISLNIFDDEFVGIIDTEWTQYNFYIRATESRTFKIQMGLGASGGLTSGIAYFSDIAAEKITAEEFTAQTEEPLNITSGRMIKIGNTDSPDEGLDTPADSFKPKGSFDWFWIPTLTTVAALIIAVVVTMIKRIDISKMKARKVASSEYDKDYIKQQEEKAEKRAKWRAQLDGTLGKIRGGVQKVTGAIGNAANKVLNKLTGKNRNPDKVNTNDMEKPNQTPKQTKPESTEAALREDMTEQNEIIEQLKAEGKAEPDETISEDEGGETPNE